jgi:hypothetical protein
MESDPGPPGYICRIDQDHGTSSFQHISIRLAFKNIFVIILGSKIASIKKGGRKPEPVYRFQHHVQ